MIKISQKVKNKGRAELLLLLLTIIFLSLCSGASTVAIDNKIEQAMVSILTSLFCSSLIVNAMHYFLTNCKT